jgi:hypothetical protein
MSIELLKDPISYAKRAVDALESQLVNAKSSYKKIKLNSKIKEWKKFIELMESKTNVEEIAGDHIQK